MTIRYEHGRRAAASLALLALAACGGGTDDPGPPPRQALQARSWEPPGAIPADAHLKGMWSPVYPWPVIAVHSVLLPDGRLMTYGSDTTGLQTGHANYDIWDGTGDPGSGHLTLPNTTGTDIFCSSQLVLPDSGKVFIAGGDQWTGWSTTNGPNNNSNLFDGTSNTLTRGIDMQRPRWYSSSTTLVDGSTYIQGGSGGGDHPELRTADGTFHLLDGIDTGSMSASFPRNFVAPDGRLFGYDPEDGGMYWVDPSGHGRLTPAGRFNTGLSGGWYSSTAMYRPGHILQMGGNSNGAYTIDITSGHPVVEQTESMSSIRAWVNATLLADGKVVATSGSAVPDEAIGPNNTAEIWDPATGRWTVGAAAQKMRLYHSNAILLPDGSVLTSGGGATAPYPVADPHKNNLNAEIWYPPYLFTPQGTRAVRPVITKAPAWIDIGKTYDLQVEAAAVSRVTLVKTGSVSHSFNFDQRFLELPFKADGGHLAIQAPTRAGQAPPGYYMLFVFDGAGVPSVAKIVRMGVAREAQPATAPRLDDPGPQEGVVGQHVDLALQGSDPNGDTLAYAAAGLPPGLAIDPASGRIAGVPTRAGRYDVVASASDGVNSTSTRFTWTVQAPQPLGLTPPAAPPFVMASATAHWRASAAGAGQVRYRWDFGDGSPLTDWSTDPEAHHVYQAGGTYAVSVSVTDDSGTVVTRSFSQAVYLPLTARSPTASTELLVDGTTVWVVNGDNDSVSAFDTETHARLAEVPVGESPRTLAIAADGMLWVANKRGATISIIDTANRQVVRTLALPRGSQPHGLVMSPTAATAFVALEAAGQVLRFDTARRVQTGSLDVGPNVRHLAVSADGRTLYASRFITPPLPGEGTAHVLLDADHGAEVLQVDATRLTRQRTIVLHHSERPDTETSGHGIPNYLGAMAISPDGTQAYVPGKQDNVGRGTLRNGAPLNFENTVRAVSSRIDLRSGAEDLPSRIDHDNAGMASAAAFEPHGVYLFVALPTSREVAVLDAHTRAQLFRIDVDRAPQGLAVSPDGMRLYVSNATERTVSVHDLAPLLQQGRYEVPRVATLETVARDKLAPEVLLGKQLFYDARDTRLARDRYMSCASCHDDGGHDGRTWDMTHLGEGLRNTIALRGRGGMGHGRLHWSNNFDEVQDFEGQIRALAGGSGLMNDADFATGSRSLPLGDPKAGVSRDLDALAAYVASLSRFDPAPARPSATHRSREADAGLKIFDALQCAACHAGAAYTNSGAGTLMDIGTLKPSSGKRLSGPLTGIDVPTLRDVWATAPYLHDGSAPTLEAAVRAHRGVKIDEKDLSRLTAFLREIGSDEPAAPDIAGPGTGLQANYYDNPSFKGKPVLDRTEAIDFDWSGRSPGKHVPTHDYSVRWVGRLVAPATGDYRLQTVSDDGVRVWVDDLAPIDHWDDHAAAVDTSGVIHLVAGQRLFMRVDYYQRQGDAVMRLRWQTPGNAAFVPIPPTALLDH